MKIKHKHKHKHKQEKTFVYMSGVGGTGKTTNAIALSNNLKSAIYIPATTRKIFKDFNIYTELEFENLTNNQKIDLQTAVIQNYVNDIYQANKQFEHDVIISDRSIFDHLTYAKINFNCTDQEEIIIQCGKELNFIMDLNIQTHYIIHELNKVTIKFKRDDNFRNNDKNKQLNFQSNLRDTYKEYGIKEKFIHHLIYKKGIKPLDICEQITNVI